MNLRTLASGKTLVLFVALVLLPLGWSVHRLMDSGQRFDELLPQSATRVHIRVRVEATEPAPRISLYLPQNDARVALGSRWLNSDLPAYSESYFAGNRVAAWEGTEPGRYHLENAFTAVVRPVRYEIDPGLRVPGPTTGAGYLENSDGAFLRDAATLAPQLAPPGTSLDAGLRAIFDYCRAQPLGESVTRSQAFVTLARESGVPARTVTGLLLDRGHDWKELTWAEARVGAEWIPFCVTRGQFARLPHNYLPIRRDGTELLVASPGTLVHRSISLEPTLDVSGRLLAAAPPRLSNPLRIWSDLEDSGVPVDILRVLATVPLGALVLVFLRNVVGMQTFGFFLPLLVAMSATRTGLGWGLVGFFGLIALLFLVRIPLERQRLLHFPQMAILLTCAVGAMIWISVLASRAGNANLGFLTFFPFAVLTITTERFSVMVEEEGVLSSLKVVLMTTISISLCYFMLSLVPVQAILLGFPELLLPLLFANYAMGRWMGVRLMEYWRFRALVPLARVRHA